MVWCVMYDYKSDGVLYSIEEIEEMMDEELEENPEMEPYGVFDFDKGKEKSFVSVREDYNGIEVYESLDSPRVEPFSFYFALEGRSYYLTLDSREGLLQRIDSEVDCGVLGKNARVSQHHIGKVVGVGRFVIQKRPPEIGAPLARY